MFHSEQGLKLRRNFRFTIKSMLSNFIFSNKSLYCSPEFRIWVALRFRRLNLTKTVLNLKIFMASYL